MESAEKKYRKQCNKNLLEKKPISLPSWKNKGQKATLKALEVSDTNFVARFEISRRNRYRKQCNKNLLEKTPISLLSWKNEGQREFLKAFEVSDTNFVARFGISTKS